MREPVRFNKSEIYLQEVIQINLHPEALANDRRRRDEAGLARSDGGRGTLRQLT